MLTVSTGKYYPPQKYDGFSRRMLICAHFTTNPQTLQTVNCLLPATHIVQTPIHTEYREHTFLTDVLLCEGHVGLWCILNEIDHSKVEKVNG